ncbi:MAG: glycosyltransferase family 4 protein [Deltaproteobacteria bacterium]|uniref:Glycosyltransferase family 4 protein n=1 Tax=Candidatus Zymogenus saltonus TaxID=2844893 RepID=A0A9D8KCN3_9DELT|nr:glycosyltransferase family 4 protein [Candidatus Zymogenus saltonus]
MKILQVFADWKWTGPSEPILLQTRALMERGNEVVLSAAYPPKGAGEAESIVSYAKEMGIKVDGSVSWDRRTKPGNLFGIPTIIRDTNSFRRLIDNIPADIVSAHSSHDHFIAKRAIRGSLSRPLLVRTDHKRDFISGGIGNRFLMNRGTDGVVTFSRAGASSLLRYFRIPRDKILVVDPALDLDRWDPALPAADMRSELNIPRDAPVIGMVARFQKYRKTDVVISAFAKVLKKFPNARLLLIGRSSQMEESVVKPARRLGIEDKIITPGYMTKYYRDALKVIDIFVFMMPGSDGTARALREAMGLGIPVAAAKVGMIPEIVEDGVSGLLMEPNSMAVETVLLKLLGDEGLRKRLGRGARERGLSRFDVKVQAEKIENFFRGLISNKGFGGA